MSESYPFQLQPLPYTFDALEPYIDTKTMELHHDKHLRTYVTNLNNALEKYPEFQSWSLEKLLFNLNYLPESIRTTVKNNGGGVYNHNLFFKLLSKNSATPTSGPLFDAIIAKFDSIENFKNEIKSAGLEIFGSGWAWLVADKNGTLYIIKTPNQDTQILCNLTPVINLDVWEHAYYLKNQNRRNEYIDNWFHVINWAQAEQNYAQYLGKT